MMENKLKSAVNEYARQLVAVVTVSLAGLTAQYLWSCRRLERKLNKKRESCQKTFKEIERNLQKNELSVEEKDAILLLPLAKLQNKLQSCELKAVDVLGAYQDKALQVDAKINCVTEFITEASELAASCDETGDRTRLLHGIPLSVKENVGIKGYDCTAGLQKNIGIPCLEDSVPVQVFKRHGAIPFVKTNIPQAMLSFTCSNPLFGMTVNPLNQDHCPGGSSGGEGALIGAGGSVMGLGTDVGGSVRIPAAFCGACSLKPTLGRFSKLGVYSVTSGQNEIAGTLGSMARDVSSLVVMTRILASPDMFELDPTLPPVPFQEHLLSSTHRLKIGYYIDDGNYPCVPVVCRAVQEAKSALESLGHKVVEFTIPNQSEVFPKLFIGTMAGADQLATVRKAVEGDYKDVGLKSLILAKLPCWLLAILARIVSLKDPRFSKSIQNMKSDGRTYTFYGQVRKIMEFRMNLIKQWKKEGLDAVICPVFPSPAPRTKHIGLLTAGGSQCAIYNVVNFPAGVVPVTKVRLQDVADVNNASLYHPTTPIEGFLKQSCDSEESVGLPVAVQCVTLPYTEELCLRVMRELEAAVSYSAL